MLELLQATPITSLETESGIGYEVPGIESLASLVLDQRRKVQDYSGDETGATVDAQNIMALAGAASSGWRRTDWEAEMLRPYVELDVTTWTFRSKRMGWGRPARLGRKVSLREAWEQVGRMFEEAEARRQKSREIEAREFFGLPDDESR
jgi:hypothetical protein